MLLAGGAALDRAVDDVLGAFAQKPFIFNLGHGVLPNTDPDVLTRLAALVREETS